MAREHREMIAGYNAAVMAGDEAAIEECARELDEAGVVLPGAPVVPASDEPIEADIGF